MPLLLAGCGPKADEAVFDPDVVATYRLKFEDADWEDELAENFDQFECDDRTYLRAKLVYENPMTREREVYEDVGVRFRGHNIYLDSGVERSGYKISFDEFVEGGAFHEGLRKVNLLGTEGDYSLLHERLALWLMREVDVPAGRVNHAELFVNGKFMGLFPNSEEPDDDPFLATHFPGQDGGSLYKVKGYCGYRADLAWAGDDPAVLAETYEPKADTDEEDMREDLIPMLACASEADDAAFSACIGEWIDVDEWLTEIAVDVLLPDVDGMASAGQNFMMYFHPAQERFLVYPWDKDLAFYLTTVSESKSGIFDLQPAWLENASPHLVDRLRTVMRDDYCAKVLEVAEVAGPDRLLDEVDRLEDQLLPFVRRDPFLKEDQWTWAVDYVRQTIETRHPEVVEEARACSPI
ncbi:MAG: CotH kinase family protein [Myxococcota bacterium]